MTQTQPVAPTPIGTLPAKTPERLAPSSRGKHRDGLAALAFLAPNFLGFSIFLLLPVILSVVMAFTNWSLKPAIALEFVGLRNFKDLLWVQAKPDVVTNVSTFYMIAVLLLVFGAIGSLWANVAAWKGARLSGILLAALGLGMLIVAIAHGAGQGIYIAAVVLLLCGVAAMNSEENWNFGVGILPALSLAIGIVAINLLSKPMWSAYELRDLRFWEYSYNTIYLMIGTPFSIAGSLALALMLSDEMPLGGARKRIVGSLICLALAGFTLVLLWGMQSQEVIKTAEGTVVTINRWGRNAAVLGAVFWIIAALGFAFNVLAFRTIFYLPTFTAGVALMILWKALYNPTAGPINLGLEAIFHSFGMTDFKGPEWLASVDWAKPALIFMGLWTYVGGLNMLLYLAALSNVPPELLDAAEVDGANRWQRFRHVTWPQLAPTTFFITIMSIIWGLQGGFEQARVMTQGGPGGATTTLSFYVYLKAFQDLDLGYAASISWIMFAIIFIATAINWKFGKSIEVD